MREYLLNYQNEHIFIIYIKKGVKMSKIVLLCALEAKKEQKQKKYVGMFEEAYLDYIYAAMSLMRFVLLGLS